MGVVQRVFHGIGDPCYRAIEHAFYRFHRVVGGFGRGHDDDGIRKETAKMAGRRIEEVGRCRQRAGYGKRDTILSTCSLNKVGRLDHVGAGWKSVSVKFVMMDGSGVESTAGTRLKWKSGHGEGAGADADTEAQGPGHLLGAYRVFAGGFLGGLV